jgi:hypothetical protein
MTEDMKKLEEENSKLKEGLLDVQCRSMKNNLIFTGLSEQEGEKVSVMWIVHSFYLCLSLF